MDNIIWKQVSLLDKHNIADIIQDLIAQRFEKDHIIEGSNLRVYVSHNLQKDFNMYQSQVACAFGIGIFRVEFTPYTTNTICVCSRQEWYDMSTIGNIPPEYSSAFYIDKIISKIVEDAIWAN